jgi:hypothetical protein
VHERAIFWLWISQPRLVLAAGAAAGALLVTLVAGFVFLTSADVRVSPPERAFRALVRAIQDRDAEQLSARSVSSGMFAEEIGAVKRRWADFLEEDPSAWSGSVPSEFGRNIGSSWRDGMHLLGGDVVAYIRLLIPKTSSYELLETTTTSSTPPFFEYSGVSARMLVRVHYSDDCLVYVDNIRSEPVYTGPPGASVLGARGLTPIPRIYPSWGLLTTNNPFLSLTEYDARPNWKIRVTFDRRDVRTAEFEVQARELRDGSWEIERVVFSTDGLSFSQ